MVFTLMLLAALRVTGGALVSGGTFPPGLGPALDGTGAEVDDSLGIITLPEGVLFEQGSAVVSEDGNEVLRGFAQKFSEHLFENSESGDLDGVESIVVEGHTNSEWDGEGDPYQQNLRLSQERAFAVMEILIAGSGEYNRDLQRYLTSSGRSFSHLKCRDGQTDTETSIDPQRRCGQHGGEDRIASRRIVIRFLTTGEAIKEAMRALLGRERPDNPENQPE
jgi:outer membrane protein OmpA-like peptidoglycan-associated protein